MIETYILTDIYCRLGEAYRAAQAPLFNAQLTAHDRAAIERALGHITTVRDDIDRAIRSNAVVSD